MKPDVKEAVEKAQKEEPKKPEMNQEIKQDPKDAKIKELTDMLQRLQAEFENYKKRTERECADFRKYSEVELIKDLLPILDSFEQAIKNHKAHDIKGFELIFAQLFSMLEKKGLRPIECMNKEFNPYLHEVLLTEKDDKAKDNLITEELQKGYMLNSQVIRTSKVKVNKL